MNSAHFALGFGIGTQDSSGNWLEVYYPAPLLHPAPALVEALNSTLGQASDNRLIGNRVHELEDLLRARVAQRDAHRRDELVIAANVADFAGDQKDRRRAIESPLNRKVVKLEAVHVDVEAERREGASRTRPDFRNVLAERHHARRGSSERGARCGPNHGGGARALPAHAFGLLSTEFRGCGRRRSGLFGRAAQSFDTFTCQRLLRGGHFGLRCRLSGRAQFELRLGKPGEATRSATDRSASRTDGRVIRVIAC